MEGQHERLPQSSFLQRATESQASMMDVNNSSNADNLRNSDFNR